MGVGAGKKVLSVGRMVVTVMVGSLLMVRTVLMVAAEVRVVLEKVVVGFVVVVSVVWPDAVINRT